jgi:hypothetical protein
MLFLDAFVVGFGIMLGVEIALGLCMALKYVTRSKKK